MLHCFLGNPRNISFPEEVIWCWIIPQKIPLIVVSIYPFFFYCCHSQICRITFAYPFKFYKKSNLLNLSENVFKMKHKVHFTVNHTEILIFIIILWTEMEDESSLQLKLQDRVQIAGMNGCLLSCINLMHFTCCSWHQFGLTKLGGSDSNPGQRPSKTSVIIFQSASGNAHANGLLHYSTVMNLRKWKYCKPSAVSH